jgi:type 1 glutamine amidotransferase
MELFKVNTSNNVLTFSPRKINDSSFSITDPHLMWKEYQRIEIQGKLTNTVNSGIVYIGISSGLSDSLGNKNDNNMQIALLK